MCKQEDKKLCPRCGEELHLRVKSYPMGSVFRPKRVQADLYECPVCRRIELFAAENDLVTCPVCGFEHSAQERCFICAMDAAFGGEEARERRKKYRKERDEQA